MIKRRKLGIEGDVSNLPWEIVYKILLILPVKSLLRFRCVCKSWCDEISELQFVRSHLNKSIKLDRQSIFIWDKWIARSSDLNYICYDCFDDSKKKLCFPCKKYRDAKVAGSCNGLVLLWLQKDKMCVLWNPSTRAYKKFSYVYEHYVPRGLCYDSSTDDYKVLFLGQEYFVVFSFRGQCWTQAKHSTYKGFCYNWVMNSVVANGLLHMVAFKPLLIKRESTPARVPNSTRPRVASMPLRRSCRFGMAETSGTHNNDPPAIFMYGDTYKHYDLCNVNHISMHKKYEYEYVIVYFDTVDEKFKEIPPPNCIKAGDGFDLVVMKGCLSLYYSTIDRNYVEVWTMKQYGEHNSWTKFIAIPRRIGRCSTETRHISFLRPLCVTKKGEIVMLLDGLFTVIYNPKNNKCTRLGQIDFREASLALYVDSFDLPIQTTRAKGKRKKQL